MYGLVKASVDARAYLLIACSTFLAITGCGSESPETLLAQARQYEQAGDHRAAMIQLKNALQETPDNREARLSLANIHIVLGDGAAAEKEARRAAQLGAPAARTVPAIARAQLLQGQFQRALDELERSGMDDAGSLALRGEALLGLQQGALARQAYAKALERDPAHVDAMLGLARQDLLDGDLGGAARLAEDVLRTAPDNTSAWLLKGELAKANHQPAAALAAYDRVLAIAPKNLLARLQKAHLLMGNKDYAAARAELAKAAQVAPNNPGTLYVRGLLEAEQGQYKEALAAAQAALRVNPDHWPTVFLAGSMQLKLRSLPQAEEHLRRYVQALPGNADARRLLAAALTESSQAKEALKVLAPVLERDADAAAFAMAGKAALALKQHGQATAYLERAVALDPKLAEARRSLGLVRIANGQRERGFAELEAAERLDPGGESGLLLALTALRLQEFDKALSTVKTLESRNGAKPELLQVAGQAYLGKRQDAEARASFERAVRLAPAYFPAVASLAEMDRREHPAAARQRLTAYVTAYPKSVAAMNALANLAGAENRMDQVTYWLERARDAQPHAVPPVIQLSAQYLRTGQQRKALALIRNAQVAHSSDASLLDMLGQAQLAEGDTAGAIESYQKLASLMPDTPLAHLRVAAVHVVRQNDGAAESALKKVLQLQPDHLEAEVMLLQVLKRQGRGDQMQALLRQVQAQKNNAKAGYMMEGDWMAEQKRYPAALAAYEKAYQLGRTRDVVLRQHMVLAAQGNGAEGLRRVAAWQKEHPDDVSVRAYLAEAYTSARQYKPAIEHWQALLKNVQPSATILNNLAWAYHQEKDARALPTAEQAYKLDSKSGAVADTLGWILVEEGQVPRGIAVLKQAVAVAPSMREARYHLAYALKQSGDKPQARAQLQQLIAAHGDAAADQRIRALLGELN
ncbi:XrtA/PEP-CTERM system TPR-repeat protein PrsT [Pseudoduganella albidiflava]|uniref:PEP-CTERM system TPR-repeat protein PrsT n=1 Tax=Pseudoduganella albidiflava TaxID=321983 RepID=A0A411X5U0_9BURK|nr:XrtA/PEP-CTERM system TPR-repeat protein PrsT [Pseudoduganella albidiflava]QBI04238.1 PEP-CTERM system TPR-repeat protein PrsT [Pseudoduganella albidiflava]GGY25712.1 hypothetical protein GCM10007387_04310 [Pseudoduganella albidiflava]